MRTPVLPLSIAAVAAVLALTGCTGPAEPGPTDPPSTATTTPTEPGTPSSTPTAAAPVVEKPVECETLDLAATTVTGGDLGPCIQAVLVRYDSGTLTISGDELAGKIVYHYDPMFEFRGELETGAGPASISFVDGAMLLDDGDGPVVADVDSADVSQQEAGSTAEIYRVFSDPGFMGDLIGAGETWQVSPEPEDVETPDGTVEAYRLVSAAPYTWYDIPVESYTLWITTEGLPVAAESTTGFLGRTATITQKLSGLGDPVTISPLS